MSAEHLQARPHNVEMEQGLLGALLLNNEIMDRLTGLEPDHFYDPIHALIFETARDRILRGDIASPVTMKTLLASDPGLAELGGTGYLANMAGAAISVSSAPLYAAEITGLHRRRLQMGIIDAASQALAQADDADAVIAEMESALLDVDAGPSKRQAGVSLGRAMETALDRMNVAYSGETPPGISLGIPELTSIIGKAQPGDFILVGARPSMGKSALAGEIARRVAKAGTAVVYWCHEMAPEDNAERILSSEVRDRGVRVEYRDARMGKMGEDQFRALLQAGRDMEKLPIHFVEPSIRDVRRLSHELRSHARRFLKQGKDVLLVIDYIQQLDAQGKSRYEVVTAASAAMKALAMDLRCPVLVLSQLSRRVEDRENKRPSMADLRESGQLEQDANTIVFLYREEYYLERQLQADPDSEEAPAFRVMLEKVRNHLELIVAKQRSGPLRTAVVGFDGAVNSIWSLGRDARGQEALGL